MSAGIRVAAMPRQMKDRMYDLLTSDTPSCQHRMILFTVDSELRSAVAGADVTTATGGAAAIATRTSTNAGPPVPGS